MICKCRKCGDTVKIKIMQILINIRNVKTPFLCQQCMEIELWKIEKRKLVFCSSESIYNEYNINGNCVGLTRWIERLSREKEKLLKIYKTDDTKEYLFPIEFVNDYLWCANDIYDPVIDGGIHKKGQMEIRIPINKIRKLKIINIYDDYVAPDVVEPVYGYKGVALSNGILGDGTYIYELDIPYQEEKRNPYKTDFQDVYSHFCLCMEDVLFRWGRDYISLPMRSSAGLQNSDMRLFKVKGEGHCFKTTQKGWVSNKLTLIKEVSQKEIIAYFSAKPELKDKMINYYAKSKVSDNIWIEYMNTEIKPYKKIVDQQEIERMFIYNCDYRKMGDCNYQQEELDMAICKQCRYYPYHLVHDEKEYNYLIARSLVLRYEFDVHSESYQYLVTKNSVREISSIQRIISWLE